QQNGAAEGPAELVLPELGLGPAGEVGDEVVGVELVVAQELEGRAVEFVGPRLDGNVHGVAGGVAVFGREVVGLHLEFLHGVDGGDVGDAVAADVAGEVADVVVHAVEQDVVGGVAAAAGDEGKVGGEAAKRSGAAGEQSEEEGIAAVEGQLDDAAVLNDLAQRRSLRIQQRGRSLDHHGFGDRSG